MSLLLCSFPEIFTSTPHRVHVTTALYPATERQSEHGPTYLNLAFHLFLLLFFLSSIPHNYHQSHSSISQNLNHSTNQTTTINHQPSAIMSDTGRKDFTTQAKVCTVPLTCVPGRTDIFLRRLSFLTPRSLLATSSQRVLPTLVTPWPGELNIPDCALTSSTNSPISIANSAPALTSPPLNLRLIPLAARPMKPRESPCKIYRVLSQYTHTNNVSAPTRPRALSAWTNRSTSIRTAEVMAGRLEVQKAELLPVEE